MPQKCLSPRAEEGFEKSFERKLDLHGIMKKGYFNSVHVKL